jgi:hypothetical protein
VRLATLIEISLVLSHYPHTKEPQAYTYKKYTRLGYRTGLSRLHTLDLHLALAFLRSSHSATADPEKENNQGILDKLQVPHANPPVTGLHNSN